MPLPADFSIKTNTTMFEVYDEGVYEATVGDLTYKGERTLPFNDKKTGQPVVRDEIEFRIDIAPDKFILQTVSNSWSPEGKYPASSLYTICKAVGLAVTDERPSGEDLNELIGQPIMLVIKNKTNEKGDTRSRITEYLPSAKRKGSAKLADEVAGGLNEKN